MRSLGVSDFLAFACDASSPLTEIVASSSKNLNRQARVDWLTRSKANCCDIRFATIPRSKASIRQSGNGRTNDAKPRLVTTWRPRFHCELHFQRCGGFDFARAALESLGTELAVTDPGTDLHFGADLCNCADDLAAIVHGDAVAATQRGSRSQDA